MGLEKAAKTSAHMREGLELYSHDGIPLGLLVGGLGEVGSWRLLYPKET